MKRQTVGYVVRWDNALMELFEYREHKHPRGGVLLLGRAATLFRTRKRAEGAIRRTMRHYKEGDEARGRYRITPLKTEN